MIEDANQMDESPDTLIDKLKNPNEEDYVKDNVTANEHGIQDNKCKDYKYVKGQELKEDSDEGKSEGGGDLGPEDGEDNATCVDSDIDYSYKDW